MGRVGTAGASQIFFEKCGATRSHQPHLIALWLNLFLAGDIVQTIVVPSWESLAILGGVVIIRTIIAFFLNRYIKEFAEK